MSSHFDNYLADFAQSGNRYNLLPRLTASGKASGLTAEDIIERVRALGVHDRDRDIRRLWEGSKADPSRRSSSWRPPRPAESPTEPIKKSDRDFVPVYLRDYWKTATSRHMTADAFAETIRMSEADYLDAAGADIYPKTAARQLRELFQPGEKVWAGWIIGDADFAAAHHLHRKTPIKPIKGDNLFDPAVRAGIIEAHTLADRIEAGLVAKIPTHVSLNPVTGTADANGSFDSSKTIAVYRHALVEWDKLFDITPDGGKTPSQAHIETVAGIFDYAFDTDNLRPICAVYTGGKSIHVAMRVKAEDLAAYKRQTAALRDLFTSADDPDFRADPAGWDNGYTHIRLAGAIRPETGRRARLLFATPDAFDNRATIKGTINEL